MAWDGGYLFHPDERQILMVASRIELPSNLPEFFSADSTLNPKFFAYGSFPIYLLKILSAFAPVTPYSVPWRDPSIVSLALVGRALSALFDLGTLALIFFLGRRLYDATVGLIAAASVSLTVLHIQLAHFYAVDTLLTFFVVATMFFSSRFAVTARRHDAILTGAMFGLALTTKISAAILIVPMLVAMVLARGRPLPPNIARGGFKRVVRARLQQILGVWKTILKIGSVAFIVFVVTQPYALLDPIRYFGQAGTEALVVRGWYDFPYTRQYADTWPFVYPIAQSAVWGMSLPLGIFTWVGSALFVWQWWRTREWQDGFILSWALVYFLIVGGQFAKYLRYLLPLLPFLFLMAGASFKLLVSSFSSRLSHLASYALISLITLSALAYAVAFDSIYSREHPWLEISNWIYQNIPANSSIAIEHWDDMLPVSLRSSTDRAPTEYRMQTLPMYDADDAAKLQTLVDTLASSDYVVLASQRLYATIPRLPLRYPLSSRYYRLLFDGQLGFDLVAFARNDPSLDGITIADDTLSDAGLSVPPPLAAYHPTATIWSWGHADESFTVYDHPMPLVFKKVRALSKGELHTLLAPP